jgi:CTP:molybdopterin cytidylyltransferase MocA
VTDAPPTASVAAALILAAGEGRRLGRPKALVSLDGELLVDRAVRVARTAGCDPVVVVLGAAADEVVRAASLERAVVVVNEGWSEGIGSSLRCGLSALADQRAGAGVVLLVDQPNIGAETVRRLVATWQQSGARAVTASYDGQQRNPVLLDASTWAAVAATAQGDVGARAWLREHADDVVAVACDDLGSDADIDTPADLERYVT